MSDTEPLVRTAPLLPDNADLKARLRFAPQEGRIWLDGQRMMMLHVESFGALRAELVAWLEEHEYESLEQMRGSMNLSRCPNPREYERTNYVQILQTWEA